MREAQTSSSDFSEAALTFLNTAGGFRRNQAIINFPNAVSRTLGSARPACSRNEPPNAGLAQHPPASQPTIAQD
jgi:hypothetical protein